jgi:hypothetical protein
MITTPMGSQLKYCVRGTKGSFVKVRLAFFKRSTVLILPAQHGTDIQEE